MIGHNTEKINWLIEQIERSYNDLGSTIAGAWPSVVDTLKSEWVGPDEVSFQEQLANKLIELYRVSRQCFVNMAINTQVIGNSWIQFQNQNIISGARAGNVENSVRVPNFEGYDIERVIVVNEEYDRNGNKGIVNGIESASRINSTLDNLVTVINDKLTESKSSLVADGAFLGANQAETIEGYFGRMTSSVGTIIELVKELQPTLTQLINAYNEQATVFNTNINNAAQDSSVITPSQMGF